MPGARTGLFACPNFVTFLSSLPVLAAAVILRYFVHTKCSSNLEACVWLPGVFLLLVSLAGMICSWFSVTFMLWIYQWVLFLLILGLSCFTVVIIVMEESGQKHGAHGDLRLKQFSVWLQAKVYGEHNWLAIGSCLSESQMCSDPSISRGKPAELYTLKNGCCKPPSECGFVLKNGSIWTIPKPGLASDHQDCRRWSSEPNRLLFLRFMQRYRHKRVHIFVQLK